MASFAADSTVREVSMVKDLELKHRWFYNQSNNEDIRTE